HDFAGCDPQLLRSGIPAKAGRNSRAIHHDVVQSHQAGNVPPFLRAVLRDAALGNDRRSCGDGTSRIRDLAGGRRSLWVAGAKWAGPVSTTGVLDVPPL